MIKKTGFVLLLLVLFASCSEKPQETLMGSWIVDYNETFKAIKNSDIWEELGEAEMEMFPDLLEEMISGLRITITHEELITEMGSELIELPYEIVSSTKDKIIVSMEVEKEKVEVTFSILNKNLIMFSSSATDDMDYMVWKREVVQKV